MELLWLSGLIITYVFARFALKKGKFCFKAGVTGSCVLLITAASLIGGAGIGVNFLYLIPAFVFSIAGDAFLSFRRGRDSFFIAGIGMFFVAHVFYIFYVSASADTVSSAVIFAFLAVLLLVYFGFRLSKGVKSAALKAAVLIYTLISCLSLSVAVSAVAANVYSDSGPAEVASSLVYCIGILFIVFSDICIGENGFAGREKAGRLILPTYYAAHMILTASVILGLM